MDIIVLLGVKMFISKHEKIFIIIFLLLCAIFCLNIGYAKTSDKLEFVTNNKEFNIIFKNEKVISSFGVDQSKTYIKISSDMHNIFINIPDLELPGANVEFSVDVVNKGKVDAKIESVVANGFENSNVVKFIILNKSDYINKILQPGQSATINFKIEWDEKLNTLVDETLNFNIEVNCSQAI